MRRLRAALFVGLFSPIPYGAFLEQFRQTKLYDLLAAAPLILFYGFAVAGLAPQIAAAFRAGPIDLPVALKGLSLLGIACFATLQIVLFLVRRVPVQFSEDWPSRAVAFAGANASFAFLLLPRATLPPAMLALCAALSILGSAAAVTVAFWLGRSFAILPQARRLVVSGPYRFIRHPLYLAEAVAALGVMLQFRQPWALMIAIAALSFQIARMHYEERVLCAAYPAYRDYIARTARLIPGVY
jgi:protein-S-isoprenylcysteine O-methyltransferase Ste14